MPVLEAKGLSLGFSRKQVVENLDLRIQKGEITIILGPNGSGKSTILKAFSRNLKPLRGSVYLHGRNIYEFDARSVARQLAFLPQSPQTPGDITVKELVAHGRFPHQSWWRGETPEDASMVDWALKQTGMAAFADRNMASLSGGERQRAWITMALAQNPEIILLDEPTTHLDICHQIEILELLTYLNRTHGLSVVMVLHDINQAACYADRILLLKHGRIYAEGTPGEVISEEALRAVFGVEAEVRQDKKTEKPFFIVRGLVKEKPGGVKNSPK